MNFQLINIFQMQSECYPENVENDSAIMMRIVGYLTHGKGSKGRFENSKHILEKNTQHKSAALTHSLESGTEFCIIDGKDS